MAFESLSGTFPGRPQYFGAEGCSYHYEKKTGSVQSLIPEWLLQEMLRQGNQVKVPLQQGQSGFTQLIQQAAS